MIVITFISVTDADASKSGNDGIPDLDCGGFLGFYDPEPGSTVTGEFFVENIGDPDSELDWEIIEWPEWGTWTFTPESGENLKPEDGAMTIETEIILPSEIEETIGGEIKIVNIEDNNDFCIVSVIVQIPPQFPSSEVITWIYGNPASGEIMGDGLFRELKIYSEDNTSNIRIWGWRKQFGLPFHFVKNVDYVWATNFLGFYIDDETSDKNYVFGIAFGDIELDNN